MSDVLVEKGIEEGIKEGEDRLNSLNIRLMENNRFDDLKRTAIDEKYRAVLYTEFHLN